MSNKHWYCVNQMGVATLCADKLDAVETARDGDKLWPHYAPHYAAYLRKEQSPLTQRKIQSVIESGEYREMKGATVLVNENGHAAIVNYGGAFYWVDNDAMAREWDLAARGITE